MGSLIENRNQFTNFRNVFTIPLLSSVLLLSSQILAATDADGLVSPPTPPTSFAVTLYGNSAEAHWHLSSDNGGEIIKKYVITARPSKTPSKSQISAQGYSDWRKDILLQGPSCTASPTSTECNLSPLINGVKYYFSIYASNVVGKSKAVGSVGTLADGYVVLNNVRIGPGAIFGGVNLGNADLRGAKLDGLRAAGISGNPTFPPGYRLMNGVVVGPGVNLNWRNLSNFNFSGVNLSGATLNRSIVAGANFAGSNLTGAQGCGLQGTLIQLPEGWQLRHGKGGFSWVKCIFGPGVSLKNLQNISNLSGFWLDWADLSGLNLTGADFTNAYLTNTNLTNTNLTGANLTNANLTNANLTGANLTGVTSGGIAGSPLLPAGWQLINGFLIGP